LRFRETLINLSSVIPSEAELPVFGQFREVEEPFGKLRAGSAFVFPTFPFHHPGSTADFLRESGQSCVARLRPRGIP